MKRATSSFFSLCRKSNIVRHK